MIEDKNGGFYCSNEEEALIVAKQFKRPKIRLTQGKFWHVCEKRIVCPECKGKVPKEHETRPFCCFCGAIL